MAHFSPKRSRKKDIQSPKLHHRSILNKDQFVWGIHSILEALKVCPHCVKEISVEKLEKSGWEILAEKVDKSDQTINYNLFLSKEDQLNHIFTLLLTPDVINLFVNTDSSNIVTDSLP